MAVARRHWTVFDALVAVGAIVLLTVFSPIIGALITYAYVKGKFDDARYRRYLKQNEGAKYFCYTNKTSGAEFARQNILPYMDDDVQVIYMSRKGRINLGDDSSIHTLIGRDAGGSMRGGYPCVAKIVDGKLVSTSLNTEFYRAIARKADPDIILRRIKKFFEISDPSAATDQGS